MGFVAVSPHLDRPRASNPRTVFGVGFAVGVDFEQSSDYVCNDCMDVCVWMHECMDVWMYLHTRTSV